MPLITIKEKILLVVLLLGAHWKTGSSWHNHPTLIVWSKLSNEAFRSGTWRSIQGEQNGVIHLCHPSNEGITINTLMLNASCSFESSVVSSSHPVNLRKDETPPPGVSTLLTVLFVLAGMKRRASYWTHQWPPSVPPSWAHDSLKISDKHTANTYTVILG